MLTWLPLDSSPPVDGGLDVPALVIERTPSVGDLRPMQRVLEEAALGIVFEERARKTSEAEQTLLVWFEQPGEMSVEIVSSLKPHAFCQVKSGVVGIDCRKCKDLQGVAWIPEIDFSLPSKWRFRGSW